MNYLRRVLAGSLLLISSSALAQDLAVRVTYKTVAVPARQAISDLAQLTHVDLRVDDELGDQPLILRLGDVPLKDAMDRIATTLHGAWSQNKTQFTLMRTDDIKTQLQQAANKKKLDRFSKVIQKQLKDRAQTPLDLDSAVSLLQQQQQQQAEDMKQMADFEKQMKDKGYGPDNPPSPDAIAALSKSYQIQQDKRQNLQHLTGDGRLYDRVLAAMDPGTFLSPYAQRRIVFSTDPKPMQAKLQMSEEDFEALVAEQNVWTEALEKLGNKVDEEMSFSPRRQINPANARVVAIGEYSGDDFPFMFQIYIVDSKGNQLVECNPGGMMSDFGDFQMMSMSPDFSKLALPKVKLSPLAREMFAVSNAQMQNSVDGVRPASDALHQFLLDSANHDPLSLAVSETLIGIADGKSWNMVASPPDDLATYPMDGTADAVQGDQFLEECAMSRCSITTDGGWLTLSPSEPLKTEAERTNRASLGQMLQGEDKLGYASIDDMAAFAAANGPKVDTALVSFYLKLCYPAETSFQGADMSTLRFYGLLSGQQRESLIQGNKVQLQLLGADQQDALTPLLLGPSSVESEDESVDTVATADSGADALPAAEPAADQAAIKPAADVSAPIDDGAEQPLSLEVTEFLQQLPHPTVVVSMSLVEDQAVHVKATITPSADTSTRRRAYMESEMMGMGYMGMMGSGGETWATPEQVAMYVARKRPNLSFSYATAPEKVLNLGLKIAGKITVTSSVAEHHKDTSPFGPYEKLPDEIRKKADESLKMYQQFEQPQGTPGTTDDQDDAAPPKKVVAPPCF